MFSKGMPKEEFITMVETMCHGSMVTTIQLEEIMSRYGDLVRGDEVIRKNPARPTR